MSSLVGWSIVSCSSYLRMSPLIAALLRPKTSSIENNLDYSAVCVQQALCPLLAILTPNLATYRRRNSTSDVSFLFHPTGPTAEVATSKFILITVFFWSTVCLIKGNVALCFAFTALGLNCSLYHRSPTAWSSRGLLIILVMLWSLLTFVCALSFVIPSQKPAIRRSRL